MCQMPGVRAKLDQFLEFLCHFRRGPCKLKTRNAENTSHPLSLIAGKNLAEGMPWWAQFAGGQWVTNYGCCAFPRVYPARARDSRELLHENGKFLVYQGRHELVI